jgi:hypothetical protein
MEITIAYFWLLKLCMIGFTVGAVYMAIYKHQFRSKMWLIILGALLLIAVFTPFRMAQPPIAQQQTYHIEHSKVLPERVTDNSFNDSSANVKRITDEDLK